MKKFTTTFFLLMAMVLLLPTEVGAWSDVYLFSTIDGVWSSYNKTDNDKFTKTDVNTFYKDIDATDITGDISFCLYVTDNNGFEIFPYKNDEVITAEYEAHDSWSNGAYKESRNNRAWKIKHSSDGRDKYRILFRYDNNTRKFYVNVIDPESTVYDPVLENEDEISCFVEVPSTIDVVKIWAWNGSTNYTGDSYKNRPSLDLKGYTTNGHKIFKWTYSGTETKAPSKVIFSKGGNADTDKFSNEIAFTNHGYYVYDGTNNISSSSKIIADVSGGETTTTTTAYIKYGGEAIASTSTEAPYVFTIPKSAYDNGISFALQTVKTTTTGGNTTTEYTNYTGTGLKNNSTGVDYTATTATDGSYGANWEYMADEGKEPTGNITVTLNTTTEKVSLKHAVAGTTPVTGENYYLIGDWNNWKVDKTFKFQPVMGEPGKYMLYINAPVNMKNSSGEDYINEFNTNDAGGYVLRFIIAPEDALSGKEVTWGNCYRPETNNPTINITGSAQTTGTPKKYNSSENAWKLQRNNVDIISGVNNGGSYRFILDMSDSSNPKWEITSTPNTRVLYFLKGSDNYLFDGNYLIDLVGTTKKYNQNFEGIVSMEKGEYYKLSDGYHIYKSIGNGENQNGNANRGSGEIKYQEVGYNYTADERVIFPYESGSYIAKANVLNWNELNMWKTEGPSNKIEWRAYSSGGTTQLSVSYSVAGGEEKLMTFDAENKVWYASCVEIGNSEDVKFKEKHDSDIAAEPTEKNDPNGEGTYKLIYVDTQTTADGKPVDKLLLSNDLGKITNEGVFIRTFSDYYARLIPEGLTAYYATGYDATNKTVNLTSIKDGIIPANTGVVLIYDGYTEGINFDPVMTSDVQTAETVSLEKTDAVGTAPRNNGTEPYGYGLNDNGAGTNWLVTDLKHDKASAGPVTRNESNVITYRNYYLANMDLESNGSKTLGFYRVKAEGALTNQKNVRKAYLAMPASVQTDGSNDELQDNTSATPVTAAKRVTMIFDGEIIGGTPTGIDEVNVNTGVVSKDNSFYNLQGIKVSKPSKGIYIYQGKKIVIK